MTVQTARRIDAHQAGPDMMGVRLLVPGVLNVGPGETYATIAAAMAVANSGEQILLKAGYSNEAALVTVDNLSINGQDTSKHIDLTLDNGIISVTLLGSASISVLDNLGNNTITGNAGSNLLAVTGGIDVVHGGDGADRLYVEYSDATAAIIGTAVGITDGGGHAVTFDTIENFTINTGSGNDTLTVGDGENVVNSAAGNDTITVGHGANNIVSGGGNDTITAGDGGNIIWGGFGDDTVTSGSGVDALDGGSGNDTMTAGLGRDTLNGGAGNDTLTGGRAADVLIGGIGLNILDGGIGHDTVDYSSSTKAVHVDLSLTVAQAVNLIETDTLTSIENVIGSDGADTLAGSTTANALTGGLGSDRLDGGGGSDLFVYDTVEQSTSTGRDVVTGFNALNDTFDFAFTVAGVDSAVMSGAMSAGQFDANLTSAIGAAQLGAHHAVIFDPTTGNLAGDSFLVVDANGQAGYQAGEDIVVQMHTGANLTSLDADNFI